ncbi:SIR2 family protein [Xanthomonas campestris pv. raphani]|uniref:SIR2 family protein n=1 Tax=Xanthomonas campestris TaxID=339 RepID=UPI002B2353C0|nr:SIR2 family protein [Xanthomonas campestris]MEA9751488.1 SIR2 family protein [Xanthomonas campestris pv. raphani]MEA9811353.1 SIR2 family protein [Xanthomonas campestris pv. raphani]
MSRGKKRALIIVGAGASIEYGIPATVEFGKLIEDHLANDTYCRSTGGYDAYCEVKSKLESYYAPNSNEAHFERIYHVLHELAAMRVTRGAVPRFKHVLNPFINPNHSLSDTALRAACRSTLKAIYKICSEKSRSPKEPLTELTSFLKKLSKAFIPRIYSTNYDTFFEQASPGLFTGFTNQLAPGVFSFSPSDYLKKWDQSGIFHLHGSVHLGFPHLGRDIGELAWFESTDEAIKHSNFSGSGTDRMDGTTIDRSAVLTGLDKLGRIQEKPFSFYYAGLGAELTEADLILVIGSGLADLHLNSWLRGARTQNPKKPLIYVSYWQDAFSLYINCHSDLTEQTISMLHELKINLTNLQVSDFCHIESWTVDENSRSAVWSGGFFSFLESEHFGSVLRRIGAF